MKKFKIQSFLQKNFIKKSILIKTFSKFFSFFNQETRHDNIFWLTLAEDVGSWSSLEDDYLNFALGR